jgi:hypothetical protein
MHYLRNSALLLLCCSGSWLSAQTDCPTYNQIPGDKGMSNDANMKIVLLNDSTASWATGDAAGSPTDSAETAISGWAAMPGSNQDYSVTTNTGAGTTDTGLQATGTAANPVVVVEQLTPAAAATKCNGSVACTTSVQDASGTTTGAIVYVSTAIVNGTPPADYPSTLTETLSHEIGVHDDMGWADCAGSNCGNTDSGSGMYTAPGPTPCDKAQAKTCGR